MQWFFTMNHTPIIAVSNLNQGLFMHYYTKQVFEAIQVVSLHKTNRKFLKITQSTFELTLQHYFQVNCSWKFKDFHYLVSHCCRCRQHGRVVKGAVITVTRGHRVFGSNLTIVMLYSPWIRRFTMLISAGWNLNTQQIKRQAFMQQLEPWSWKSPKWVRTHCQT